LALLPPNIQRIAQRQFESSGGDPRHPVLEQHILLDTKRGRHRPATYSVEVTKRYRALCVLDNGPDGKGSLQACWYWIGSHEDYNTLLGSK
jgi:hypothetical protein